LKEIKNNKDLEFKIAFNPSLTKAIKIDFLKFDAFKGVKGDNPIYGIKSISASDLSKKVFL